MMLKPISKLLQTFKFNKLIQIFNVSKLDLLYFYMYTIDKIITQNIIYKRKILHMFISYIFFQKNSAADTVYFWGIYVYLLVERKQWT